MGSSRVWVCAFALTLLAIRAIAAPPATASSRLPVPDRHELANASRHIDELLARETPHEAKYLLKIASETTSSPALRYSATVRAIGEAADAGQTPLVLKGLDQLRRDFDIDLDAIRLDVLRQMANGTVNPLAVLTMRWTEDCYREGRVETALKMADVLRPRRKVIAEPYSSTVNLFFDDADYCMSLVSRSTTRPAPPVTPITPEFACLYQNRWPQHLKELAGGAGPLASIAQQDLAATSTPAQMKAAEAWWQEGASRGGLTGWRIAGRAVAIYGDCIAETDGVERELIVGRLNEHVRHSLEYSGYLPGVAREISHGGKSDFQNAIVPQPFVARDDETTPFPRSDPHVEYRGLIAIGVPGPYQFIFNAGSSLKVEIDGTMVLDNPTISRKRNGDKVTLDLSPGMHGIRLELSSSSSRPRITCEWITPGAAVKAAIPASAFYHDPLLQPAAAK